MRVLIGIVSAILLAALVTWAKSYLNSKFEEYKARAPGVLVILVHNCEDKIEGIIRDLINWRQINGDSFELVVIDQGSSDSTKIILEKLNYPYQEFHVLDGEIYRKSDLKCLNFNRPYKTVVYAIKGDASYAETLENLKKLVLFDLGRQAMGV